MKWVLLVLGFLLVAVAAVLVTGWLLPKGHVVTREAIYHQAIETLFETITDVSSFPSWREGIQSVELLSEAGPPLRFRETGPFGEVLYEVVESRPPGRLVVRIADESLPYGGFWTYQLIELAGENGTKLAITETGEVKNPIFRFFSTFVFSKHATIDRYLLSLGRKFGETVAPRSS